MNNENRWVQPTPLRGNRSNLIEFPVNALPPILREMAYAIARTTSTDVSMAATAILSSVSYCFSGQFRIIGKKDHSEPLVIDSLIVAEASFKKSPVMKLVSQTDEKLLFLDEKAKEEYVFLHDQFVEQQLITDMAFCSDWGGKFHGLVLRICGILHCIKTVLNGEKPDEVKVSHDTMCNAIEIGHYFRLQAIYAYGLGDTDNQTLQAERILAKVRSKNISEIRQNDLYKLCRCKLFKNAQEFSEVIAVLEEYGYLRSETIPAANGCNRSGVMLRFNPNIYTR